MAVTASALGAERPIAVVTLAGSPSGRASGRWSSSSAACCGRPRIGRPDSIRDSSTTRRLADDLGHRRGRVVARDFLVTAHLGVGERRHLRQVGDHQHLVVARQAASAAPTARRGLAADAGVDLVEHQGAGASVSTRRSASMAGPARRPRPPWPAAAAASPGLAAEQERDVVAGVGRRPRPRAGPWASPARAGGLDRLGQARRGGAPGRAHDRLGRGHLGAPRPRPARRRARRRARRGTRARRARSAASAAVGDDVGQRVAVLAAQLAQQLAAGARRASARGRPRWPRRRRAARPRRRRARRRGRAAGRSRAGERRPAGERGQRRGHARRAAPPSLGQRVDGGRGRLAVGDGVGQRVLLGVQRVVLVGIVEAGGVELVDLEAQQVDLPGPRPLVAAERGERGRRPRPPAPCAAAAAARGRRRRSGRARPAALAGDSSDWWACWPWRSTRRAPDSASVGTVARRPST